MSSRLLIAGTHSGVGKTTITLGLIAALRRRGLRVQPFKCGPDYIDPTYHARAASRPCRNLDTWMMPPRSLPAFFERTSADADIGLIEGVMGVFDGLGYDADAASTAEIAKLLQTPVVLVMDVSKQARSAAAVALGFRRFDEQLPLAGYILNRVGSDKHGQGIAWAIEQATGLPVLGWLPRVERLQVAERHLGLVPTIEPGDWDTLIQTAADSVVKHLDVDRLIAMANKAHRLAIPAGAPVIDAGTPVADAPGSPVIAVARDEAFHFIYEENLELLRLAGATLEFFSPLRDADLPAGTRGIILSGGFPEIFAEQLSANNNVIGAMRRAHERKMPIYAECGGLMYLTESITDLDNRCYPMVGVLPGRSVMTRKLTLGYRLARAGTSSWLLQPGESLRGHEFHYSIWQDRPPSLPPAYLLVPPTGEQTEARPEGAILGKLHASYVHVHFWNLPDWARRFVEACRLAF
jgi:cobyrinic acid a,c-diamide synthase